MTKLIVNLVDSLYQLKKKRKCSLPWTDFLRGSMEAGWWPGWWSLVLLLCWKCGGELVGCFLKTLGVFSMVPLGHVLHSRPLFQSNEDLSNNFYYLEVWMWEGGESNWIEIIKLCNATTFKTLCVYASWTQTRIDQCKKHWHLICSGWKFSGVREWEIRGWMGMMEIILISPKGLEKETEAQVFMRELILKLCWEWVWVWYLISSKAVGWCSQRTSTLHLPEFVDKIHKMTAQFHMIRDLQCLCGAAEGLR